jgi:hypothetical protein
MDSLSKMMAVSDRKRTKNPKKTNRSARRKNHVALSSRACSRAAKEALNERIQITEKYPLQDLTKWIEQKYQENQQEKWNNTTTAMKERKPHIRSNRETRPMTKRYQVVISRLRTGYRRLLWQYKETKEKMTKMKSGSKEDQE